jgi:hypothetical protein
MFYLNLWFRLKRKIWLRGEISSLLLGFFFLTPTWAGWQIQTVVSAQVDFTPSSLALDAGGLPLIAYINQTNYHKPYIAVYKGVPPGDLWEIQEIPGAWSARAVKLFVDPGGLIHFYYLTDRGWDLAKFDGSAWQLESTSFPNGHWLRDPSGRMHILYCEYSNNDPEHPQAGVLKYARQDGADWPEVTLAGGLLYCDTSAAALGPDHRPHLVYVIDLLSVSFRYGHYDGGAWKTEDVGRPPSPDFMFTSLKVDASRQPHLSYYDGMHLVYGVKKGGGWQFTPVDAEQKLIGFDTVLQLDPAGNPRISYYAFGLETPQEDLRLAWFDGRGWRKETVDSQGDVGRYNDMVLTADNRTAVSFYGHEGILKFALQDSPPPITTLKYIFLPLVIR